MSNSLPASAPQDDAVLSHARSWGNFAVLGPIRGHAAPNIMQTVGWRDLLLQTDFDRSAAVVTVADAADFRVHYTTAHGWYFYNGRRWYGADVAESALRAFVHQIGLTLRAAADDLRHAGGSADVATAMSRSARRFLSADGVKGILAVLRDHAGVLVGDDAFDSNPDLLGLSDGVLDLMTGNLLVGSPTTMVTKHLALPNPTDAPTPTRWLQFLEEVLPDKEVRDWLQIALGYGITGYATEQIMLMFVGSGSNGKSQLLEALRFVLKEVTVTAPPELFGERQSGAPSPEVAMLQSARIVLTSETDARMTLAAALVKRMTGDEEMTARELYGKLFSFSPKFLPILATNWRPRVNDSSHGMWRRLVVVPFEQTFSGAKIDSQLQEKLIREADGILAWLLEGADKWFELNQKLPALPSSIAAEVERYRDTSDTLGEFLDLHVVAAVGSEVSGADMYRRFKDWSSDEHNDHVIARRTFEEQLRNRMRLIKKPRAGKVWVDVALSSYNPHAGVNPMGGE